MKQHAKTNHASWWEYTFFY